jgi:hypothetical protein
VLFQRLPIVLSSLACRTVDNCAVLEFLMVTTGDQCVLASSGLMKYLTGLAPDGEPGCSGLD